MKYLIAAVILGIGALLARADMPPGPAEHNPKPKNRIESSFEGEAAHTLYTILPPTKGFLQLPTLNSPDMTASVWCNRFSVGKKRRPVYTYKCMTARTTDGSLLPGLEKADAILGPRENFPPKTHQSDRIFGESAKALYLALAGQKNRKMATADGRALVFCKGKNDNYVCVTDRSLNGKPL